MKILISAYACETGRGGEGEIGWRVVREIAANHDVWVITRANLRDTHERTFRHEARPERLNFVYYDLPWILRVCKGGKRFFLLYYYMWQLGAGLHARRLMAKQTFDVCHHLTGGMDWMPAGLSLCRAPLLWGPVGSENTHPVMLRKLPLASRLKDRLRVAVRGVMRHADPFVRFSGQRARVVLSHTPETMPVRLSGKMKPYTQTGIENIPQLVRPKTNLARTGALRILYAGELKDWKGALLALKAALKYFERDRHATLTIAGNGPLEPDMRALVNRHPEGHRVVMAGHVPMDRLVTLMGQSDVFLYPSFHHGLATVVLQAMLTGLPVICLEGDATGRIVRQQAGMTVALAMDRDPATDLADAIDTLAGNEDRRQSLARQGQSMAREQYTYASLASGIERAYREIGEGRP
ncbi:glycosyltransferase family 4 protein [uncultured Hoeflea sp.]|uniref:glycosyltransferase family 4 protein n=1 Tax=uncultured Hoeflea sp. TaxID=538666 RepID=UPI0030DD5ECE